MVKFPKVLGFLNLKSGTDPVTEANLQAAEDQIAQLEQAKSAADLKVTETEAALKTAREEQIKTAGELQTASDKVATLEEWKKNQAQVDGRDEDDSNSLDGGKEALEPWERASASAISNTKKRLGEK
ncbi:MAG: hypothetical protein ACRYF0_17430 [Janthinobacterium lividum]